MCFMRSLTYLSMARVSVRTAARKRFSSSTSCNLVFLLDRDCLRVDFRSAFLSYPTCWPTDFAAFPSGVGGGDAAFGFVSGDFGSAWRHCLFSRMVRLFPREASELRLLPALRLRLDCDLLDCDSLSFLLASTSDGLGVGASLSIGVHTAWPELRPRRPGSRAASPFH